MITMGRELTYSATRGRTLLSLVAGSLTMASVASAQAPPAGQSHWTIGASTGAYVASAALVRAADSNDTELAAGPAFSLESQYLVSSPVAVYANGTLAFGTVQLGSSMQPAVVGPSKQVTLAIGTAAPPSTTR